MFAQGGWRGGEAPGVIGAVDRAAAGVGLPAPGMVTAAARGAVDGLLSSQQAQPTTRATLRCGGGHCLEGHGKQTIKTRRGAGPSYETSE